jgi:hypothetical protein
MKMDSIESAADERTYLRSFILLSYGIRHTDPNRLGAKYKKYLILSGGSCLSFAKENVNFPRMNYRRKKISMKERLEEAIEEIGGELLQGSGFEREVPEETSREIEPAAQSFASRTLKLSPRARYTHV